MLIEIFFVIFLGIFFGIITGLIPGIHINLIAILLLSNFTFFSEFFHINYFIIFLISLGITHTFLDFIPSALFGIPSSDNVLSVLPAHKLTLEGLSYYAIYLSVLGSFFGSLIAIFISPIYFYSIEMIYNYVSNFIHYILICIIFVLILLEKTLNKMFWAGIIVLFSISLGTISLNSSFLNSPLLVLFTGLFGVSSLINSLNEMGDKFPKQKFTKKHKLNFSFFKITFFGVIISSICSITPGIGNSQAATISSVFFKKITSKNFIVITSAINTVGFIFSLITFYLIDKSRNGTIFVISQIINEIKLNDLIYYFLIIIFVSSICFFLTQNIGKFLIKKIQKINFTFLNIFVITFLTLLVFYLEGTFGILILANATSLGLLAIYLKVKRVHLMSTLMGVVIMNLI